MSDAAASPVCTEKEQLLRAYGFASGDYHRAIMVLTQRVGLMSKKDYDEIREFITVARSDLERAREALDRHTSDHGC